MHKKACAKKSLACTGEKHLSLEQQSLLRQLEQSDDYLSVSVIKIGDIAAEIRKGTVSFDLPAKIGQANATTKNLDYQSESNFVWNGEINGKGNFPLAHENGRT